jgi:hypothetical protein
MNHFKPSHINWHIHWAFSIDSFSLKKHNVLGATSSFVIESKYETYSVRR